MKMLGSLRLISVLALLTGCTAFQISTELHRGRAALLRGMPAAAITHFEQLTALDGDASYCPDRGGTFEKSEPSPSTIIGCARMVLYNFV